MADIKTETKTPVVETPVEINQRNTIVLKTVHQTLSEVASSFHAQAIKEDADPKVIEKLNLAKQYLDAIKD